MARSLARERFARPAAVDLVPPPGMGEAVPFERRSEPVAGKVRGPLSAASRAGSAPL